MNLSDIIRNITEVIPTFTKLSLQDRSWLVALYNKNYKMGTEAIGRDVFTNEDYVTTQALKNRIKEYPETSVHDTEYMKRLASGDEGALDNILKSGDEDFIYQTYEENYAAWVPKSVEKTLENIPEKFKKYDLDLLAKEAFSHGILAVLEKLAKESIVKWAKDVADEEKE
jgi:hypothetical protein